jgi:hypothetical protein
MACALPLTGSSGMPSAGQNMRDSVDKVLPLASSAKTKKPSVPNSVPRDSSVSTLGARSSRYWRSATGTNSRVLPRRAMRAGMSSCK